MKVNFDLVKTNPSVIKFTDGIETVYLHHWRPGNDVDYPTPGGIQYCVDANGNWDIGALYSTNASTYGYKKLEQGIVDNVMNGDDPMEIIMLYVLHATSRLASYGSHDYSAIAAAIAAGVTDSWWGDNLRKTLKRAFLEDTANMVNGTIKTKMQKYIDNLDA